MSNPTRISNLKLAFRLVVLILSLFLFFSDHVFATEINSQNIISETNRTRSSQNIIPLRENNFLNLAAQTKVNDMLLVGYFNHISPFGVTPWDFILAQGYDYSLAGENLAMDFATSEGIVGAWLNSPSHAKNLLNSDFTDVGVATASGEFNGRMTTIVVQMFGRKRENNISILDTSLIQTVSRLLGLNNG